MSEPTPAFKPGDVYWVKVGRKRYKTVIDAHGVQRFEQVQAVRALIDAEPELQNERGRGYQLGHIPLTEFLEFNMALGYSVAGFEEILDSIMFMWRNPTGRKRQLSVSNPLRNNGEPEVWRSPVDPTSFLKD